MSLDPDTVLADGKGYNMCGPRLYHLETNAGGQVAHTKVGETDVKPQVELRTLNTKYAG